MKKFIKIRYLIILILLTSLAASFFYFKGDRSVPYDFVVAGRRDIIQEISVVGRVKSVEEVDLSFDLGGKITSAPLNAGKKVSQGEILVQLDTRDVQNDIKDAEISLENARLSLEKIKRQATESAVAKQSAEAELDKLFEEAFNLLSVIYADIPNRISNLENAFKIEFGEKDSDLDYYNKVVKSYYPLHFRTEKYEYFYHSIRKTVNQSFDEYKSVDRNSSLEALNNFLDESYAAVKAAGDLARESRDTVSLYRQILIDQNLTPTEIAVSITDNQLTDLSNVSTKLDEYLISLFSVRQKIKDQREAVVDTDLDLKSQELTVQQKENDLKATYDRLSDHYLRAPFNGIITEVVGNIGEFVSANQKMVSLISDQAFEIEANVPETDIARIEPGFEARVTLDALGRDQIFKTKVLSIDPAGVLIDGVATYKTTFVFEDPSEIIRSGMTADIDVLGKVVSQVIAVPARAIVRKDGKQLVQILNFNDEVEEVLVETGLRGSDGFLEIVKGLKGGERVVTAIL